MRRATGGAAFKRKTKRGFHHFLALALAVSTLSAISAFAPSENAIAANSQYAFDFNTGASNTVMKTADGTRVIPATSNFTVESWVYVDSDTGGWQTILVQDQAATLMNAGRFYLGFYSGRNLHIGAGSQSVNTTVVIPLQTWTHVAVSVARTGSSSRAITYINGSAVYTWDYTSVDFTAAQGFAVGVATDGGYELDGKVDQVKIWNGALSSTDVARSRTEYASGGISSGTLAAHYDFNEGTGSTITDRSGNNLNLALTTGNSVFTQTPTPPNTTPAAPSGVSGTAGNAQVALTWLAPTFNGGPSISGYTVTSSPSVTAPAGCTNTANLTCTFTGLTNGTSYTFTVVAINSVGSSASSTSSASLTPVTTPSAPTSLNATTGNTQVALSWTAPTNTGGTTITDYLIEYSTNGTNFTTFSDGVSSSTSATVTGLTNGTNYTFRISTINAVGTGGSASTTAQLNPNCSPTSTSTNGFTSLTFSSLGSCYWTVPSGITNADVLVVGGGGGGAGTYGTGVAASGGGGGGGGAYLASAVPLTPGQTLQLIVGNAGAGGITTTNRPGSEGSQGGDSSFGTLTAGGGGGGGCATTSTNNVVCTNSTMSGRAGTAGGSGGGATPTWNAYNWGAAGTGSSVTIGGTTYAGQTGYIGAVYNQAANSNSGGAGSGGGARSAATTTSVGSGLSTDIAGGSAVEYGRGGRGSNQSGTSFNATTSGYGNGGDGAVVTANPGAAGASGAQGVVIVRYVNPPSISLSTSTISAAIGTAVSSYSITNTGGTAVSYSISPALPSNGTLAFSTSTGLISGTPSAVASSASYTITATNTSGTSTATFSFSASFSACSPTSTSAGGYTTLTFTNNTNCNWTVPTGVSAIDLLVVGGGGGGGNDNGGGGAGGRVIENTNLSATAGTNLTIVVGLGGLPGCASYGSNAVDSTDRSTGCNGSTVTGGNPGQKSEVVYAGTTYTALGGNGAVGRNRGGYTNTVTTGGYHGGGYGINLSTGANNAVGANTGGASVTNGSGGGAGNGGNGGAGSTSPARGGTGGAGTTSAITGVCYGGGGGGGGDGGQGYSGGTATCGGAAGTSSSARSNATANLGGGGGSGGNTAGVNGGTGGSGVVVVRYLNAPSITLSTSTISVNVGSAVTSYSITNSGGAATSYSISPSFSVPGLTFSTASGLISGTATSAASSTSYTITATNTSGTATASFSISAAYSICSPSSSTSGGFTVLTFTSLTACTWNVPSGVTTAEILVVGGGGGGGDSNSVGGFTGGSGGSGGYFYSSNVAISGSILVSVGTGGSGAGSSTTNGTSGGDSAFGTLKVGGGGYGNSVSFATSQAAGAGIGGADYVSGGSGGGGRSRNAGDNNAKLGGAAGTIAAGGVVFQGNTFTGLAGAAGADAWSGDFASGGLGGEITASSRTSSISGTSVIYSKRGTFRPWNSGLNTDAPQTYGSGGAANYNYGSAETAGNTLGGDGAQGVIILKYINAPSITLSTSTISVNVGSAVTSYSITNSGGAATSYSISPSFSVPGLTFSTASGLISGTATSAASSTSYTITATNTSGTSTATFSISSIASTVSTLSALSISSGTLSPTFASGTTSYTASVANSVATGFTVTPTVTQANATTVQYLGASGTTAFTGALSVGANVIRVVVTAQDGTTTATYTVTVTRAASAVAPTIGTQPAAVAKTVGQTSTFTVSASTSDAGTLSYQWQKLISTTWTNIALATSASYAITTTATSDAGDFRVVVTNTLNGTTATTTSNTATLTMSSALSITTPSGASLQGSYNSPFSITVSVSGGAGTNTFTSSGSLPAGVTLSSSGVISGIPSTAGSYPITVTVTDANAATATTNTFTIAIAKGVSTISLTIPTYTFTGSPQGPDSASTSGSTGAVTYAYVGRLTTTYASSSTKPTNVGTYTVTATLAADSNFASVSTSSDFAITTASALTPTFGTTTATADGYTVQISNYSASYTWAGTATASGSVSISGTGLVTVTGVASGTSSTATITTTRTGYTGGSATVSGTSTASNVATLSALNLTTATLSPTFASGTTSYTASVTNATTSITVTPTRTQANATITVNGTAVTSGSASGSISLNVGSNTINVVVTAQDGITTATYTVTVTRAGSNIATLSGLTLSSGTLSPTFASGTTSYTASVANSVATGFTVTPTVTQANATTVQYLGASGTTAFTGALSVGANVIRVVVTAQDGTTTATYTVTVTRAALVFTITYAAGTGGSGTGPTSPATVNDGATFTTPANTYSRTLYTFAGWSDGTNTFAAGTTYPSTGSVSANVTLTATWNLITCSTTTSTTNGYTSIVVSGVGSCGWVVPDGITNVDVLAVGGGGAGGTSSNGAGGGGGGGQVKVQTNTTVSGVVSIQVGAGGTAQSTASAIPGGNGGTTSFTPDSGTAVTANGGSGGASVAVSAVGSPSATGFNGGGGSVWASNLSATNGTNGVGGFKGGAAIGSGSDANIQAAGGGGGSGADGANATSSNGGNGGAGVSNSYSGTATFYGGGGGGGKRTSATGSAGTGGSGGGGNGGRQANGGDGTANTGGGGGGAGGENTGGAGGSGIVIIRYAAIVDYTYDANGGTGTVPAGGSVRGGTAFTTAANSFTRTGYTFAGWYTTSTGTGGTAYSENASNTMQISGSAIVLYAKWTATSLVITYDEQGGSSISDGAVNVGASISAAPTAPTRAGYTLAGWSTTSTGSVVVFPYIHGQTANFTLYAIWTVDTLTVTYNSQGGTAVSSSTVATDAKISAAPIAPTKTGYTFSGWSTTSTGSVISFTGGYVHGQTASFTLYAIWAANALTVTYDSKGGTSVANGTVNTGASISAAPTAPTKTGYTLSGWSDTDGGSIVTFPYAHGKTANFTLYAIWLGNTNAITYNSKGGSAVADGSFVTGGSIASAPTVPTRAGYTLTGWSLTDGGSLISYPYSPAATSGITLFAIWSGVSCTPTSATTGGYTIYSFTTAGTCFWTVPNGITDVEILVVAGGGGGGYAWDNAGAGGGAGGQVKTGTATLSTTVEIAVGAGGAGGIVSSSRGGSGGDSSASGISALGGTGGCAARGTTCSNSAQATSTVAANGGAGGAGGASGKGGGGSSTTSSATTTTTGGAGTTSNYSGSTTTYGVGGSGGTARAASTNIAGVDGTANTGNGGGGASAKSSSGNVNGGAGATGLVVIRIPSALTITFNSQSGSAVSDGSTLTGASIASAPTAPTRSNYTFLGWFTASTGGTAISFPYTHGQTANFTLYAQWALNTYGITFNANNGSGTMANQAITHGVSVTLNANLYTRANYVFYRWATAADGTGTTYDNLAQATLTANTTLYAQWTANTYVVTYNYNAATGGNSTTTSSFTTAGSPIVLPTPTKTGFTFAGWFSDSGLSSSIGLAGANYSPTGTTLSLNAYAKWTAINYTFTYNGNSSDSGSVPTETSKQITQTATVQANTGSLVRAGYTFDGWNTQSNGGGTTYLSGSIFTVQSSNVTLYAKWTANTYTVTYNSNGGSGSAQRSSTNVSSDSYTTDGSSISLPAVGTLQRAGYTFGGWNTSAAGNGTNRLAADTYTTVSNVTLYAKWNAVTYAISYNGNSSDGGSAPITGGYTTGQASPYSVLTNTFTKTSNVFGGWNTAADGTGTSYSPGSSITTLADVVLYAVWIPQYTLHYAINGGSVTSGSLPGDTLYNSGTSVGPVFSSVARTGYTFGGWSNGSTTVAAAGNFIIAADSVLTAIWTPINYTISYNSDGGTDAPNSFTKQIGQSFTVGSAVSKPGYNFAGWSNGSSVVGADAVVVTGSTNISYTAQWVAKVYRVSYDWNGGRGTAVSDVDYTYGTTAITLPLVGDRVKDGYNFAGWSESLNGSALNTTYIPSQTRTLYALWTLGNFTVTYDAGRGTVTTSSVPVTNGGSTVLPLPTRANFTFNGWHTAVTGGSRVGGNGDSFTPAASQTIYARWIQNSLYGITNSLSRIGSVVTSSNIANTFSGANSNSSVAVSVPANALPAGTTINFDLVGDSSRATGVISNINYLVSIALSWLTGDETVPETASGKPISITISNASIKAGASAYAIINNVSTLLGTATQDGTITVEITSDPEIVIAATKSTVPRNVAATSNGNQQSVISWTAPSSDGGSAITGYTVTSNTGATCTTSSTSCTISGLTNGTAYTFTVTATNNVGTSVASSAASATTAALYSVTFDSKGGSAVTAGSFLTASTVSEPTAPTRTGYSFAGWAATDGGAAEVFPYAPGVTTNITMYARWDALDNAVTFDSKDGSSVTSNTFSSGGTVTAPTAPTKSGYTFAGWSATDGGSVVTFPYAPGVVTDITLYAKWTVVSQNSSGGSGGGSSSSSTPAPVEPTTPPTPVKSNVTVVAPVSVVGDQDTKGIPVQLSTATGPNVTPPSIKIDAASDKFIADVKVVDGKLVLTPETGFSGKKTVTVTITENGADRIVQIPLTVLPEAVTKPVLTPSASNKTIIRWAESPNADAYTVLLNGKKICGTSATSCSVPRILGPDAVVEIISNGGDRTVSDSVETEFKQTSPVSITRLVSSTNIKSTLSSVDTKALDKVITLIKTQGFGTVVISDISTTSKTKAAAAARIAAIKKYIDAKTGSEEITFEVVPPTSRTYFNNISLKG